MKRTLSLVGLAVLFAAVAVPAFGQSGCSDTPENPTLILAGLAGGAFAAKSAFRSLSARRANRK